MTIRPNRGVFLERAIYRRKRLVDASRVLPLVGVFLFVMPALIVDSAAPTATRWVYLFVAWIGLIIASAAISRALRKTHSDPGDPE